MKMKIVFNKVLETEEIPRNPERKQRKSRAKRGESVV